MVQLVLDDIDQMSILESVLVENNIPYEIVPNTDRNFNPLLTPYLLVHGVPLDLTRSLKWIKEKVTNE